MSLNRIKAIAAAVLVFPLLALTAFPPKRAAKTAVANDDEINEDQRKKILEHLHAVEAHHDSQRETINYKQSQEIELTTARNSIGYKNRKHHEAGRRQGFFEKLFRINSQLNALKNSQKHLFDWYQAWVIIESK